MKAFSIMPGHAGINRQRLAPAEQVGPAGDGGVEPLDAAVIDREDVVAHGFLVEDGLEFLELRGVLRGEVVGLAEVLVHVVEFPHVVLQRRQRHHQPRDRVPRAGDPAFVVDAAVAEHLEILRRAAVGGLRRRRRSRASRRRPSGAA